MLLFTPPLQRPLQPANYGTLFLFFPLHTSSVHEIAVRFPPESQGSMPTQNKRGLTKKTERQVCNMLASVLNLQSISEELVHLGDARRNAQVDGAVADLDDKPADNVRVDFVGDLELLALPDVLGLGDGGLEAGQRLVVEGLCVTFCGVSQHGRHRWRVGGKDGKRTWALVTLSSTSPRAALMMAPNFSQTPFRRPRRLFSASVLRKFLTVSPPAPACLASSATMADLSSAVRVGAARISDSLGSFSTMALRLLRALAVGSRVEVLAAAVY